MVKKAPQAYRNIREVSEMLGVEPHVLRFWESKFSKLKPMTRGGGRRFYAPDDIALIETIRELLHNRGLTIKAASRLIEEHGIEAVNIQGSGSVNDDRKQLNFQLRNSNIARLLEIDNLLQAFENKAKNAISLIDEMIVNLSIDTKS